MSVKKGKIFDKIDQIFDVAVLKSTDELMFRYKDLIIQEMPKASGEMARKTRVIKTRKVGKHHYRGRIVIDVPYAGTVHDGVSPSEGIRHYASKQVMKFPVSAWKNGPEELSRNGFYYFKSVKYHIKPNKFVDRAERKMLNVLTRTLMNNIIVEFNTLSK